jgi:hypothetical protein
MELENGLLNSGVLSRSWTAASAAIEGRRDELITFWLCAPDDILEQLWASDVGRATTTLVKQLRENSTFTSEQVLLRDKINGILRQGFNSSGAFKALIAAFLLSPPGKFKISNPESLLPSWLASAYKSLYEDLGEASRPTVDQDEVAGELPNLDFGEFPKTLQELCANRLHLNRMLGLSNLYYIDPEDKEILNELKTLRVQLANLIQLTPEDQLEAALTGDFGDRYWAMVRCGVQNEGLDDIESVIKNKVTQLLTPSHGGGFGMKGSINAFLVAMLFYLPGTMKVDDAEAKLPAWIYNNYRDIYLSQIESAS